MLELDTGGEVTTTVKIRGAVVGGSVGIFVLMSGDVAIIIDCSDGEGSAG